MNLRRIYGLVRYFVIKIWCILVRDLWFVVDCVAAFVFKFLLWRLISVWIWICWLIYEVMSVIVLLYCPFFYWYAGYVVNE